MKKEFQIGISGGGMKIPKLGNVTWVHVSHRSGLDKWKIRLFDENKLLGELVVKREPMDEEIKAALGQEVEIDRVEFSPDERDKVGRRIADKQLSLW